MPEKKRYVVEFLYNDNDEFYQGYFELTAGQATRMTRRLERLLERNRIRPVDGTDSATVDSVFLGFREPTFWPYSAFRITSQGGLNA